MTLEQYAELVMQANSDKEPVAGDDIDGNRPCCITTTTRIGTSSTAT